MAMLTALFDACVLHPAPLRDFALRSPPKSTAAYLETLLVQDLPETVALLRQHQETI